MRNCSSAGYMARPFVLQLRSLSPPPAKLNGCCSALFMVGFDSVAAEHKFVEPQTMNRFKHIEREPALAEKGEHVSCIGEFAGIATGPIHHVAPRKHAALSGIGCPVCIGLSRLEHEGLAPSQHERGYFQ